MRYGEQLPTLSMILPYEQTLGDGAIELYNSTDRTALPWQETLIRNIMAVNEEGLFVHTKFGYSLPRRNGKSELIIMRTVYGLLNGEQVLYTAHRTSTSHSAWERICDCLAKTGYTEGEDYKTLKQFGLERIEMLDGSGGRINFRTRSSKGGLGEGYDVLIIDEAQEYTDDQESALKYVVTDSQNPQTIMCGTPPTAVSAGTVFLKLREKTLAGQTPFGGWAEWSVSEKSDPMDKELWYKTNPSLGYVLSERNVISEMGADTIDANIQRLGLWLEYSQKSAISLREWEYLLLKDEKIPDILEPDRYLGIKFGHDGKNVCLGISARTKDSKVFVEAIDCRNAKEGIEWLLPYCRNPKVKEIVIDGASGQNILADAISKEKLKAKVILPKVQEVITANSIFENNIYTQKLRHKGQRALTNAVSNSLKRPIGSGGGFGYKCISDDIEAGLIDCVILSSWRASLEKKEKKVQRVRY